MCVWHHMFNMKHADSESASDVACWLQSASADLWPCGSWLAELAAEPVHPRELPGLSNTARVCFMRRPPWLGRNDQQRVEAALNGRLVPVQKGLALKSAGLPEPLRPEAGHYEI